MKASVPDFYGRRWSILLDDKEFISEKSDSFKCRFEVTHEFGGVISYTKISIYNLSAETIAAKLNRGVVLTLRAGYVNNIDVIAKGAIINSYRSREGVDTVINLICTEGNTEPKKLPCLSATINKGASVYSVMKVIAEQTGLGLIMNKKDFANDKPTKASVSILGDASQQVKSLSRTYEFDYTITDKLIIVLKFGSTFGGEVQTVSMETGMEDIPEFTDAGYNVKTRLNPKFKIGQKIKIISDLKSLNYGAMHFRNVPSTAGKGIYKVYKIVINGDSHGSTWTSKLHGYIDDKKRGVDDE